MVICGVTKKLSNLILYIDGVKEMLVIKIYSGKKRNLKCFRIDPFMQSVKKC